MGIFMRGSMRLAASGLVFAGVFGFLSAANAADVYSRGGGGGLKDEPAPYVAPTWAGLYVGGSVGYGWGDFKDSFPYFEESQSNPLDGVVFGGHIGYNFQRGNIVFGVEAGLNGTDMDADLFGHEVKNELNWYATGVGRLGYAFDGFLLYGFGGVAWGDVKTKVDGDSDNATHVGWTAGAGIEKAINDRFSVRLEYAHVDFGSEDVFNGEKIQDKVDASFDAVKVGISYKLTGDREVEPLK
jgi:outer membrane immunogenic protein